MADQKPSGGQSPGMSLDLQDPEAVARFIATAKIFAGGFSVADSSVADSSVAGSINERKEALRADYGTTVDLVNALADIRFKCLTFVTAVIAIANVLLPNTAPSGTKIAFSLVGFMTTLGIAVYELRNSQLYEAAMERARMLERELEVGKETSNKAGPGPFSERPLYVSACVGASLTPDRKTPEGDKPKLMRYLFVKVKHDQGLALIYGGVLGGWFYLIAYGILSLLASRPFWPFAPTDVAGSIAGSLGFVTFLVCWRWFIYHDNKRFRLKL